MVCRTEESSTGWRIEDIDRSGGKKASTDDIYWKGGRTPISLEEGGPNWSGWRTVDASWFKGWRTLRTPTGPEDVVTSYMKNGKIKILFEYLLSLAN